MSFTSAKDNEIERMHIDSGESDYVYIDCGSSESSSQRSIPENTMRGAEIPTSDMAMRQAQSQPPRAPAHTEHKPAQPARREPEGLSAQTMVSWQETLLQDPKHK